MKSISRLSSSISFPFWSLPLAIGRLNYFTTQTDSLRPGCQSDIAHPSLTPSNSLTILGKEYPTDEHTNVTQHILNKVGVLLHTKPWHPLTLIKQQISKYFSSPRPLLASSSTVVENSFPSINHPSSSSFCYRIYDHLSPIVTVSQNFDSLCFPNNHIGRSQSDTYYINRDYLLRTHTSAHETELLKDPSNVAFLTIGDVYRRDEIDAVHYPVFHQVEAVRRYSFEELYAMSTTSRQSKSAIETQKEHSPIIIAQVVEEMKREVEGLVIFLFGPQVSFNWIPGEFPFTFPSYELEIIYRGKNLEICGCGVLRQVILSNANQSHSIAWAAGFGLERLAMILYDIPDIRYFWSEDRRFLDQFVDKNESVSFTPFSKYPPISRDISFWLSQEDTNKISSDHTIFQLNTLYEIIREEAGDLVESVSIIDKFTHATTGCVSLCFRITYRSMSRNLTDLEINAMQESIRRKFVDRFQVILR